jgi:uncharacterized protein (UPF0264 family)
VSGEADAAPLLLISVFSLEEVDTALAGGADIVDLKNPLEGSLGAAPPRLLRAVRKALPGDRLLSAALGDAPHLPGTLALAAATAAGCGADYVKVGLLGSSRPEQAAELLAAVQEAVEDQNPRTRVIGVAYADARRVGALPPEALPPVAREAGIHGIMLDTAVKDGASSFHALGADGVAAFLASGRGLGLRTALAGALGPRELAQGRSLGAGILGVRGSACDGGRRGRLDALRIRELRDELRRSVSPVSALP